MTEALTLFYAYHSLGHSSLVAVGSSAHLAVQLGVGLLSQRRLRALAFDHPRAGADQAHMILAGLH